MVTLAPVTLALVAALLRLRARAAGSTGSLAGAARRGGLRDEVHGGRDGGRGRRGRPGRACSTKRDGDGRPRTACAAWLRAAAFAVVFLAAQPVLAARLRRVPRAARRPVRPGRRTRSSARTDVPGWLYYLWTLTWGLGVLPALAALVGAALCCSCAGRARGWLLLALPRASLFLFLGSQARFFGRWLLPAYPALCVLAGIRGGAGGATPSRRGTAAAAPCALAIARRRCSRPRGSSPPSTPASCSAATTRAQLAARRGSRENVPAGTRVVVEPFVPSGFLTAGRPRGARALRALPDQAPLPGLRAKLSPRADRRLPPRRVLLES